jgi:hypothetical protein
MADLIPSELQDTLTRFVHRRVEYIRSGNRRGLDATYESSCLRSRNKDNRHDYEWYLNLIERGFGDEIERIDIRPVKLSTTRLPFAGLVTYGWPPEYAVFVQTVAGRRTLWLVHLFEDGPRVVLPAFNGQTGDAIATGEWQLPRPAEAIDGLATVLEFHPKHFTKAVTEQVASSLANWTTRLKHETIRAVAVDCFPWFGQCSIALLTTREDFSEAECGKWAIGEWRWAELENVGLELRELIRAYYGGKTATDADRSPSQRAKVVFKCLAKALQSKAVSAALGRYTLAPDFELAVFNPDDPKQKNFCRPTRK